MPQNCLIFACDKWELSLSGTFSPATGIAPVGAAIISSWTPDSSTLSEGLKIVWSKGHMVCTLFGSSIGTGTGSSATVTLLDVRLYALPASGTWLLQWTGVQTVVGGATVYTGGAGSLSSGFIAPSGVPLIGMPCELSAYAGAQETLTGEPFSCWSMPFDDTDANSATVTGGFRYFQNGAWVSLPAQLPPFASAGGSVPMPTVSGSSCAAMTLSVDATAHSWFDGVHAHVQSHYQDARVDLVPALPGGIFRMNPDFAAMIKRYAIPGTQSVTSYSNNGSTSSSTIDVEPPRSALLEVIRSAPGLIEDALVPAYCPVWLEGWREDVSATCANNNVGTEATWTGPVEHCTSLYPNLIPASPMAGYLTHSGGAAEDHWNRVAHPLWSFALQREDWPVDGSPVPRALYWDRIGEQWLYNVALPASQQSKTRTTLLSEPLATSPWGWWLDTYYAGERWLGISRYKQVPAAPPATKTAGQTGWSFTGCTGVWSSGVLTVTPTGTGFSVDYDLGQWVNPWQFPHACSEIWTSWSGSGSAYLVGQDGSEVLLSGASGTWALRPVGTATQFAGSWAMDQGCGVVSDQGVDTGSSGISLSVLVSPESSLAFGLLPGRSARTLRFKFPGSSPLTIQLSQFRFSPVARVLAESRLSQVLLWTSGPGLRIGQWDWTGVPSSPSLKVPGQSASALDSLCTRRVVLEGRSPTDTLRTEILGLWDLFELGVTGSSSDATVYGAAIQNSLSFWMAGGPDSVLVNTAAEVPPLLLFPPFRRGRFTAEIDMYAQEPRYSVAPVGASPTQLGLPDWLSTTSAPAGWEIRQHTHALTESETDFRVRRGGTEFAHAVRPWRSFFWVGAAPSGGSQPDHFVGPFGMTHLVFVHQGTIKYQGSNYSAAGSLDIASDVASGSRPRVFQDRFLRIWVSFESGSDILACFSDDNGQTWSTPTTMITNAHHPRHFPGYDGSLFWVGFRYLSGASGPGHLVGRYQSGGDATPSAEFLLSSASGSLQVADDTFSIALGVDGAALWTLFCLIDGETDPSGWTSSDFGRTWSRIS